MNRLTAKFSSWIYLNKLELKQKPTKNKQKKILLSSFENFNKEYQVEFRFRMYDEEWIKR